MSERREFDNPFDEKIGDQLLTDDAGKVGTSLSVGSILYGSLWWYLGC